MLLAEKRYPKKWDDYTSVTKPRCVTICLLLAHDQEAFA